MAGRSRAFVAELVRRLYLFVGIFLAIWAVAAVGFYLLQGNQTLFASFYWAIVTLTTIGYGDIVPTTLGARAFTMVVGVSQLFLLGYLLTVITGAVGDERERRLLGLFGTDMRGHVVVLGYTAVGRAAVRELLVERQKVAVVVERPEDVANLRQLAREDDLFVTYGAPAETEILQRVNVQAAHSVIVCTADDAQNMIAALNIRGLVPKARIVVSVGRPELKDTLRSAGVTYVASPGDIGGRLLANAAFRPDVAMAIEDLTAGSYGADLREFLLTETTPISHQTLPEAEALAREKADCLVVGYARPDESGEYRTVLNPPKSLKFQPGDAVLVLGSDPNIEKFEKWFGVAQGR